METVEQSFFDAVGNQVDAADAVRAEIRVYDDAMQLVRREYYVARGHTQEAFDPGQHPRGKTSPDSTPGSFAPSLAMASEVVTNLVNTLRVHGGFSYSPTLKGSPVDGYMVSIHKEREHVVAEATLPIIRAYVNRNRDLLLLDGNYLGAWIEKGQTYLDVSTRVTNPIKARELATQHKQHAFFDVEKGKTVYVKKPSREADIASGESAERQLLPGGIQGNGDGAVAGARGDGRDDRGRVDGGVEGIHRAEGSVHRGELSASEAEWTPEDHPREPAGSAQGGEFASKGDLVDLEQFSREAVLATFEKQHRGMDSETAMVVALDGKVLLNKEGQQSQVAFEAADVARWREDGNATLTHNHPSGRSFSLEDVLMAARANLAEVRAVGESRYASPYLGSGWHLFTMERPVSGWPDESSIRNAYKQADQSVRQELTLRIARGELSADQANQAHHAFLWSKVMEQSIFPSGTYHVKWEQ